MSSDVLTAADSPMTNSTSSTDGHREANTSLKHNLFSICADLDHRVTNFLNAAPETDIVRQTQDQTRASIAIIEKALQDYEYVQNEC